jgi:signal transduction histidine kinase
MLGLGTIVADPALFVALTVAAVGAAALWANPRRLINRIFFTVSVHVAVWLAALSGTTKPGDSLFWIQVTSIVSAFLPAHLWLLKEYCFKPDARWRNIKYVWPFLLAGFAMAAVVPTEYFKPSSSTAENPEVGIGYYFFIGCHAALFIALTRDTIKKTRKAQGIARIELQILLLGGSAAAFAILAVMVARGVFQARFPIPLQPVIMLTLYGATVLAISTHRIFDARHLLLLCLQKAALILVVTLGAVAVYSISGMLFPDVMAVGVTVAVCLGVATWVGSHLDRAFGRYPKATQARGAVLAASRKKHDFSSLQAALEGVLRGWGGVERALVLSSAGDGYSGINAPEVSENDPVVVALTELKWATPERLYRERSTASRAALAAFLEEHELGAVVYVRGPTLNVLAGVGVRPSRHPFTYPDIVQFIELVTIMESALAQVHLSVKAQRAEQLATVGVLGASVAHEIRNPLVTIKSFVHLLPQHYDNPVFRERFFRLIGEEVSRMDRLVEQLLDLAAPRHYSPLSTSLHDMIKGGIELLAPKADERQVLIQTDLQATPDTVVTDPHAARQVLLNLCFNAIQAQERSDRERWIRLSTCRVRQGVELAVSDHGPGIPSAQRSHLFQAFHTTKSSGFGLGLAICSEILSSLDATISVDPFIPGEGAVFRIIFPCPQPTS